MYYKKSHLFGLWKRKAFRKNVRLCFTSGLVGDSFYDEFFSRTHGAEDCVNLVKTVGRDMGLEPMTFRTTTGRSNQLS